MDQTKIGAFLKELRTEKGLTQMQLAEKLNVSNRSVSRWETGSALPDVGVLIELADFYGVDAKEIVSGERTAKAPETKESLTAVADYSEAANKKKTRRIVVIMALAFIAALVLLIFALPRRNESGIDPYPIYERVYIDEAKIEAPLREYILANTPNYPANDAEFCAFSIFSEEKISEERYYVYAWTLETAYVCEDGVLRDVGGAGYPCRFELAKEGDGFKVVGADVPGDGASYSEDMKKYFPDYVRTEIYDRQDWRLKETEDDVLRQAKEYFNIK